MRVSRDRLRIQHTSVRPIAQHQQRHRQLVSAEKFFYATSNCMQQDSDDGVAKKHPEATGVARNYYMYHDCGSPNIDVQITTHTLQQNKDCSNLMITDDDDAEECVIRDLTAEQKMCEPDRRHSIVMKVSECVCESNVRTMCCAIVLVLVVIIPVTVCV